MALAANALRGSITPLITPFKNGAVYNGGVDANAGVLGAVESHTFTGNTIDNMNPASWRYAGGVGNTSIGTTMFNNMGISNAVLNPALLFVVNLGLAAALWVGGSLVIDDHVRTRMRHLLDEIRNGAFAREWIAEMDAGEPRLRELRAQAADLEIERVGKELHALMRRETEVPTGS